MAESFTAAIAKWSGFEGLLGAAAATLLGLLFVAASLRPEAFRSAQHPDFLSLGLDTITLFMIDLLIALVLLMPLDQPPVIGIWLICAALFGLLTAGRHLVFAQRIFRAEWGSWFFTRRVIIPVAAYLLLLWVASTIFTGETDRLPLLSGLQVLFLFTGTYNAWSLLMHVPKS